MQTSRRVSRRQPRMRRIAAPWLVAVPASLSVLSVLGAVSGCGGGGGSTNLLASSSPTATASATASASPSASASASPTPTPSASASTTTEVSVTLSTNVATVYAGGTTTFTATVANAQDTSVTWTVQEGTSGGTITADGVYTAPTTAGTYHIVATSNADPSKSATATVTVSAQTGSGVITIQ